MGALPINSLTFRTPHKFFLGFEYVFWNLILCGILIDAFQFFITDNADIKEAFPIYLEIQFLYDLFELFLNKVAIYLNHSGPREPRHLRIARKYNSIVSQALYHYAAPVIFYLGIESQYPQPSGKPAQLISQYELYPIIKPSFITILPSTKTAVAFPFIFQLMKGEFLDLDSIEAFV